MKDAIDLLRRHAQEARDAGRIDEAVERQQEAVALLREDDDPARLAHAIRHVADILREAGDAAGASAPTAEMLALYRGLEDAPLLDLANAIRSAALQAEAAGQPDAALWREARDHYEACGIGPGVAEAERRIAALG